MWLDFICQRPYLPLAFVHNLGFGRQLTGISVEHFVIRRCIDSTKRDGDRKGRITGLKSAIDRKGSVRAQKFLVSAKSGKDLGNCSPTRALDRRMTLQSCSSRTPIGAWRNSQLSTSGLGQRYSLFRPDGRAFSRNDDKMARN